MNLNYTPQDDSQSFETEDLLAYCKVERTTNEIMNFCGLKDRKNFRELVLNPLLKNGLLLRIIPDKPTSRNQKYLTKHG